ncbi:HTH-type transcriptional activator CmpR [Pelagimonas phthalicica]|uniref:HTH-type transcriptional activator CmpR n=1 Tax=Pelagimonas phthalicica TaxID=1037362 RepID=A0A238JEI8_9RHOB|nr:LysR family transcriptional regulator [Pelagimonas phthalicica]TDS91343.1 LysR family transcriptional regulator [Pelagimonas phthalicica]SMX28392.1 HTH-type transcriptional activator CmpR [Pelagimonas phthalicica]
MRLRFRQLQAFHAIVEVGTVTGAAEALGISQPGISNLLAELERQTGLKLFERLHGRLVPTPEAELMYREVDTVVRGLDHVTQTVVDLQNKQAGQLQVASQHSMSFGFMPRTIAEFARTRPDMNISFQSQYSSKIQEWVLSGLFEIGICEMPMLYDTLNVYPLHVETKVALHRDNPLAAYEVLTPELLRGEPFIVMGPDHITQRRLRDVFEKADVPLKTRVNSHLFKNLLSFVKEGMGVSLLDRFGLEFDYDDRFVARDFEPRITMDLAVITSATRPLSQVGKEFLAYLLQELEPYSATGSLRKLSRDKV